MKTYVSVSCPHCSAQYDVHLEGRRVKDYACSKCRRDYRVVIDARGNPRIKER